MEALRHSAGLRLEGEVGILFLDQSGFQRTFHSDSDSDWFRKTQSQGGGKCMNLRI